MHHTYTVVIFLWLISQLGFISTQSRYILATCDFNILAKIINMQAFSDLAIVLSLFILSYVLVIYIYIACDRLEWKGMLFCIVFICIVIGDPDPSWSCSNGSWIYNFLCNQCPLPLKLWVRIPLMARCIWYNIKFFSNLRQVGDFLWIFRFPASIKLTML